MAGSEDTRPILEALRADRSTARERQTAMERQIKAEARRLRSGGDARAALLPGLSYVAKMPRSTASSSELVTAMHRPTALI